MLQKLRDAGAGGLMMILIEVIVWFVVILLSVYLVTAVRKIAVQYARRTVAGNIQKTAGSRDYIPLKLNAAGVMPIIFAQAIMFLPMALGKKIPSIIRITRSIWIVVQCYICTINYHF